MAFLQRRLLLFLWQRGRWLRLPFCRCRPLSCCANRGTRKGPNHRSNDGEPTTVPATAPATAPPRALPVVPVGLSAVFSFLSSSMFFPPSWRQDARPLEPTCQRAPSFYSLARAVTLRTTFSQGGTKVTPSGNSLGHANPTNQLQVQHAPRWLSVPPIASSLGIAARSPDVRNSHTSSMSRS